VFASTIAHVERNTPIPLRGLPPRGGGRKVCAPIAFPLSLSLSGRGALLRASLQLVSLTLSLLFRVKHVRICSQISRDISIQMLGLFGPLRHFLGPSTLGRSLGKFVFGGSRYRGAFCHRWEFRGGGRWVGYVERLSLAPRAWRAGKEALGRFWCHSWSTKTDIFTIVPRSPTGTACTKTHPRRFAFLV
jgi:hypothetical protein